MFCSVAFDCLLANVDSATRMVGSTDIAYYRMLKAFLCTWFIPSGSSGFESSVLIGSCAAAPYLFGAEGYGACCCIFHTSCLYFFSCLVMYTGIEISIYHFCIVLP